MSINTPHDYEAMPTQLNSLTFCMKTVMILVLCGREGKPWPQWS